jgi:Bacterial transcriptional activator domain
MILPVVPNYTVGDLLENLTVVSPRFDEWLAAERTRLSELATTALRRLTRVCAEVGDFDGAVMAAARLVAMDELREDSHRLLIETLARAGRRAGALRQLEACARVLRNELNIAPDTETTALAERIRSEAGTPASSPPLAPIAEGTTRSISVVPQAHNLEFGNVGSRDRGSLSLALGLADKPSIAVLPFVNIGDDPEQQYFADGMVEEIITALSRIRWLFVIARNSSFPYKTQAVDVKLGGSSGDQRSQSRELRAPRSGGRSQRSRRPGQCRVQFVYFR